MSAGDAVLRAAFAEVVSECMVAMDDHGDAPLGAGAVCDVQRGGDAETLAGLLAEASANAGEAGEMLGRLLRAMPLEWWREVVK